MVRFSVNGREIQYEPREETRKCLLDFLRDDLGLTGTKDALEKLK